MKIPSCAGSFVTSVMSDCESLIENSLWPVSPTRFENWHRQFASKDERFFTACLLHQLTVRTHKQFEAGLLSLFRGPVSSALFPEQHDLALTQMLASRSDPRIRLVPAICDDDPPTKSGPIVLRRLQRLLGIFGKWLVWPWQAVELINKGAIDAVVFVDDFLGSGSQFETFFKRWEFPAQVDRTRMIYAPITAHATGINHVIGLWPPLRVLTTELLSNDHGFFSDAVWNQVGHGTVTGSDAYAWYAQFAKERGIIPRSMGLLGVGELALTYGFAHSTPNNTLPILWYQSSTWHPLLER